MGVILLKKYKFTQEHYTMIVKAIIDGYREYIEHRKDRDDKMIISSAFAWTKGNFIESKIAETCEDIGFTYLFSKAGPTWQYLQFIDHKTKNLFLIKNAKYFNSASFANSNIPIPGKKQGKSRTYLHELSKINRYIEFSPKYKPKKLEQETHNQLSYLLVAEQEVSEQLELFRSEYESFHILTYELDSAQQITKIMHYLPNPNDNIAYEIADLSNYISGAELTDEERKVIAPEKDDFIDPAAFDFGILDEEKENN